MRSFSLKSFGCVTAALMAMGCANGSNGGAKDGTGGSNAGGNASGGDSGSGGVSSGGGSSDTGGKGSGGTSESGGSKSGGAGNGGTGASGGVASNGGLATGTGGKLGTGGSAKSDAGVVTDAAVPSNPPPHEDFTEKVGSVSFDMVYIPGGTFTLGCEAASCPSDTKPVSDVKVSSYHIGKTEVTTALMNAALGTGSSSGTGSATSITWYDSMAIACKLSQATGKHYRMMTEAEFEYAAKNYLSKLEKVGTGEEWAYNSWNTTHMGGTDPVGPNSGKHTQKTRRDAQGTVDNITGRLIRSIDGIGPALRLVISDEMDYPPDYVPPCDLKPPVLDGEPTNSYRDPRWVTGSDAAWGVGAIAVGKFDLRVWDDGTARLNNKDGQWFTSNNIAFVFVPSSGSPTKFPYIFLDETQASLISDTSFMSGGFVGRIEKKSATNLAKPTVSGLKSGEELATAAGPDYKMVDMVNIPESAKQQDSRLIDGPGQCWFQNNINAGGTHNYRKDIDADEFRFAVIDKGNVVMLANGKWFTVNNTFLQITHSTGYTTNYLYAITPDGYFFHDSYQKYERADFRMFQIYSNTTGDFPSTCLNNSCSSELPKGDKASLYSSLDDGVSTFVPAPCPTDGCK
jgi:hypothetical protein